MRKRTPLRAVGLLVWLLPGGLAAAPSTATAPTATPTPTPIGRPRLSGGFGRTPAPSAVAGDGQSMADVVHAAEAGRDKDKKDQKGVAITNESLVKDPNKGRVSTSKPASAKPASSGAAASTAHPAPNPGNLAPGVPTPTAAGATEPAVTNASPAAQATTADEAMWRDRAHRARQRVEDTKAQIAALETESKRLENEFYRWDDGQYRDRVIKPQWDKAREELETARRSLVAAEAELADLPEQARKAGALPGWLRE